MRPEQVWQAALGELQLQLTKSTYDTWLRDTAFVSCEQGENGSLTFTVEVENAYAKDWLENRLLSTIRRTLTGIAGRPADLQLVVQNEAEEMPIFEPAIPSGPLDPEQAWQTAVEQLQGAHVGFRHDAYLLNAQLLDCKQGDYLTFVVGVQDANAKWQLENGQPQICAALFAVTGRQVDIRFVVLSDRPEETQPASLVYNLPRRYLGASTADLDPASPVMKNKALIEYGRAIKSCYRARTNADHFQRKREGKPVYVPLPSHNLIICGPAGVGKTHIAASIGQVAATLGFEVVFVGAEELIRQLLRDIRSRSHEGQDLLMAASECDLLILDDLNAGTLVDIDAAGEGAARTRNPDASVSMFTRSEWAVGEIKNLIHTRYDSRRGPAPVIVTSNQSANELQMSALDNPVISRLIGGAAIAEIPQDAIDYRYHPYRKSQPIAPTGISKQVLAQRSP